MISREEEEFLPPVWPRHGSGYWLVTLGTLFCCMPHSHSRLFALQCPRFVTRTIRTKQPSVSTGAGVAALVLCLMLDHSLCLSLASPGLLSFLFLFLSVLLFLLLSGSRVSLICRAEPFVFVRSFVRSFLGQQRTSSVLRVSGLRTIHSTPRTTNRAGPRGK